MSRQDRFLRACRRQPTDATPIWLMRQAGRFMAEYRRLREQYGILELIKTPELAAEVTMQPVNAFDIDAAIIFADILPPLEAMGLDLEFVHGDGPMIHNPVRTATDVEALAVPSAEESLGFTLEAIRITQRELAGRIPLLGFSGAPFTLASYAVEGRSVRDFGRVKGMMYAEDGNWQRLMEKLSAVITDYLAGQIEAGADAVQLFDSWGGMLSPADYRDYVLPYTKQVTESIKARYPKTPLIFFATNTSAYLSMFLELDPDVIGVDWRIDMSSAFAQVGDAVALQGNLDPATMLASPKEIERQAARVLDDVGGRLGHVFNLGHGVLRQTPVEHVRRLVDFVHDYSRQMKSS